MMADTQPLYTPFLEKGDREGRWYVAIRIGAGTSVVMSRPDSLPSPRAA